MYLILCGQFALAAACLSQISISVTLFKIGATRSQRLTLWIVISLVIISKVMSIFLVFTVCTPVQGLWIKHDSVCNESMFKPIVGFWIFAAGGTILSPYFASELARRPADMACGLDCLVLSATVDLVLVALPWQILWRLQMRKIEKFGLGITFTAGIL